MWRKNRCGSHKPPSLISRTKRLFKYHSTLILICSSKKRLNHNEITLYIENIEKLIGIRVLKRIYFNFFRWPQTTHFTTYHNRIPKKFNTKRYTRYPNTIIPIESPIANEKFTPVFKNKGNTIKNKSDGKTAQKIPLDKDTIFWTSLVSISISVLVFKAVFSFGPLILQLFNLFFFLITKTYRRVNF